MNLNHLVQFAAIAECGSLREAARTLGLTQSAVTKSLKVLEAELGVALVERTSSGSILTPFGQQLLRHARSVRSEVAAASTTIQEMKGPPGGKVRIGSSAGAALTLLPITIPYLRSRFPGVEVDVSAGLPAKLLSAVLDGSLDMTIGPRLPSLTPAVMTEPLVRSSMCVIARTGHPLAHAKSLMELADCRWVLTSELAAPESALRRALAERGSTGKLDVPVRTDDPLLIYRLVSSTDSVSLMRSELMESGLMLGDVRKIELDDFTIEDEIVLYTKRASRGHKSAELFREALLTHAAELRRKAGS